MKDAEIRPGLFRQYHEAAYGKADVEARAFDGASFEEYFHLQRIRFPAITRRRAAEVSERRAFRKLASEMPADPPRRHTLLPNFLMLERRPALDLALEPIGPEVRNLTLSRIKSIAGWKGLRKPLQLDGLSLTLCGSAEQEPLDPPVEVRALSLADCRPECVSMALRSTVAARIQLMQSGSPPLNLEPLRGHTRLQALHIPLTGSVRGIGVLGELPLRSLHLSGIVPGASLGQLLHARRASLVELGLECREPFGPSLLPQLPALARLSLPGFEEFRSEWIDWATAHPQVQCVFVPVPGDGGAEVRLAEIYRGVDIVRVIRNGREVFEIAGDLAGLLLDGPDLDNGELEDKLRGAAGPRRKAVTWSSEADNFVMQARDVQTCRWAVDAIHEIAASGRCPS